jgi:acetylornithine deacetylase
VTDYSHIIAESWNLLKQMVSIPSVSRSENEVADLLCTFLENKNYKVNRLGNNCWVEYGLENQQSCILLNSHIDTVKPVAGWLTNPYEAVMENEKLTGLGSNDAGASVVSLLAAFRILSQQELAYRLVFLASAEEEVSGTNGIESVLKHLVKFDLGIVGEPTQMQMAVAEKGLLVIDAEAEGKAGHAARNEGINAIYKALEDISAIQSFSFGNESEWLGPVKATVTQIQAGTQHNVIPDRCRFVIDVRTTDKIDNHKAFNCLENVLQSRLTPRSFRLNASGISLNHPIVIKAREMGLMLFGSPTLSDQALMNFPSIKIGPGDSARSHRADEYILQHEVEDAVYKYVELLSGLTGI